MTAKIFFLVVAGHWSPVSAATFCCATKVVGWDDEALGFEEAVFDDVEDKEYHCGYGLKLELSIAKSAVQHDECNLDDWVNRAENDPEALANIQKSFSEADKAIKTVFDTPNTLNKEKVEAKVHYYFKKLLAQAAYFAKDYSRTLSSGTGITQSSRQTNILFGMAKVTAELRINCKYTSFFLQVIEKVLRCKKEPQYTATKCKQLWDKRQNVKAKYCTEWTEVDQKKCNEGMSRHKGIFEKIHYFTFRSAQELSKND